jgi:putative hydrolase of the HAD superfamily
MKKYYMIKAVIFDMYETLITLFESPIYFGTQIAEDIGINVDEFLKIWDSKEQDRTIGKVTLEEIVETIMRKYECYSEDLHKEVVAKRIATKRDCFSHLHPEIIPMLSELKKRKIKIGLISNCFSEEAMVIRESILFPFFDAIYMSYEQGIQKPDI